MDAALKLIMDTGVALRREMISFGATDQEIASSVRHGVLCRIRQGAYTIPARWRAASDVERHRLTCVAVSRQLGGHVALSHTSSLVTQRVATWGADLSRVHVTRLDGGVGRFDAGIVHHEGRIDSSDLVMTDSGILVSRPARAAIEHASISTVESGLVSADYLLHAKLSDDDDLARTFTSMGHWPGTQHVHMVVRLADARSESPGETRSRYLFWRHGLPAPRLQFEVYGANGILIGVCDFAWPEHGLLGEFDGRVKYGRLLKSDQKPGDVVFAEKRREDRLREITQWSMVRIIGSDLATPAQTAARVRRLLRQAA